jgi:hypothetical protein
MTALPELRYRSLNPRLLEPLTAVVCLPSAGMALPTRLRCKIIRLTGHLLLFFMPTKPPTTVQPPGKSSLNHHSTQRMNIQNP